jgi:hypothetical protein
MKQKEVYKSVNFVGHSLHTCALRWSLYNFIPKCTVLTT